MESVEAMERVITRIVQPLLSQLLNGAAMIYHSIRFQLKQGVQPDQVERVLEQLRKMGREIETVESYCVGRDIGGDFDFGATFVLKDIEGYKTYMHSPIHRKVDEIGLPLVENMVSYDITDDKEASIADQIAQIHKERFEGDKDLANLVGGLKS
jgi:hypothetical protein